MTLDVAAVASQVRSMGLDIASRQNEFLAQVRWARRLLAEKSERWPEIKDDPHVKGQPRAAVPREALVARYAGPERPASYLVAATDGSQVEPDRHGHVSYFLINTGTVVIRYGAGASATLGNTPQLYYRPQDLVLTQNADPNQPDREPQQTPIEGEILAMKRSLAEIEELAEQAQNIAADVPVLLLIDGTLTLFARASGPDNWAGEQMVVQYRQALERIQVSGHAVAGFISRSNATWVMEMLMAVHCQKRQAGCSFCGEHQNGRTACVLSTLRDRFLYDETVSETGGLPPLQAGERSSLFDMSTGLYKDYGDNAPAMFYLNTGHEIAQVQVPLWVADDARLLGQVHGIINEQCRVGNGYPTVLSRAHEQAVVSLADKEMLENLVVAQLTRQKIAVPVSEKARSKQVRAV